MGESGEVNFALRGSQAHVNAPSPEEHDEGGKPSMKVRTQADIAQLEQVPVTQRIRRGSVADLLRHAAREYGGRLAIRYLSGTAPSCCSA